MENGRWRMDPNILSTYLSTTSVNIVSHSNLMQMIPQQDQDHDEDLDTLIHMALNGIVAMRFE